MQRLFSTFPAGLPGFGLFLLRTTLGITAIVQGSIYLSETFEPSFLTLFAAISVIVCGVFLVLGFLTPIVGALFFTAILINAVFTFSDYFLISIYEIILSAVIGLLGPGAFSIDAWAFGRREIIIPKN